MEIRKAVDGDFKDILVVYECAREYMKNTGNGSQWGKTYPPVALVEADISQGISYVVTEEGVVHGVFVFFIGKEPCYEIIEGAWLNDEPYGVIHRVAGDGKIKGMFGAVADFCKSKISNIKIDTHENNHTMQHVLEKNGFKKCGVVYLENGDVRTGYQFVNFP